MSKAGRLRVPDYLGHILEAIRRIHLYVADITEVQFLEDEKTQDAVIRNFEIIGEACRDIDSHHPNFAQEHPEVPWGFAYEMRNALAHGYFKVDLCPFVSELRGVFRARAHRRPLRFERRKVCGGAPGQAPAAPVWRCRRFRQSIEGLPCAAQIELRCQGA